MHVFCEVPHAIIQGETVDSPHVAVLLPYREREREREVHIAGMTYVLDALRSSNLSHQDEWDRIHVYQSTPHHCTAAAASPCTASNTTTRHLRICRHIHSLRHAQTLNSTSHSAFQSTPNSLCLTLPWTKWTIMAFVSQRFGRRQHILQCHPELLVGYGMSERLPWVHGDEREIHGVFSPASVVFPRYVGYR